jgi:rare lipoprotein A (peptidoglycan hydrolase)
MDRYTAASSDLAKTHSQIADNAKRLAVVDATLKRNQNHLDTQAQFLYRTGGTGFVDVLLGASTFDQFASRLSVLTQIAADDASLVDSLKSQRAESLRLRAELKQKEARQATELAAVAAQRRAVQSSVNQQQAYLSSLSAQVQTLVDQQEAAAARAATTANSAPSPSASANPIKAPKPTQGMPSSGGSSTSLSKATIVGRSGSWAVMSNEPKKYRSTGVSFDGVATQYSNADNGSGTSSGRRFNDQELTCASRTLPFGTRLAVSRGGGRVIVVVTDRGPFTPGRILDLTVRAGGIVGIDGVGKVHCEIVEPAN